MREPEHRALPVIEPVAPSAARVYAILLGDDDCAYPPDRQAVQRMLDLQPAAAEFARENRAWIGRVVDTLAGQGVSQFADLGAGLLPSALFRPTHEVARSVVADARVAYVDNDPVVYQGIARQAGELDGVTAVLADLRDPAQIMAHLAGSGFSLQEPVGVIFGAVLHYFPADQARTLVWRYADLLCPGSYIAVSVGRIDGELFDRMSRAYGAAATYNHGRDEVAAWLTGLELIPPQMTRAKDWNPGESDPPVTAQGGEIWCGVGRKPAPGETARHPAAGQAVPAPGLGQVPEHGWTYADRLLGLLEGRWAHIVLRYLPADPPGARPAELLAQINADHGKEHGALSKKILLDCLTRMTARGLAERIQGTRHRLPVTFYRLSPSGRDALAALRRLAGPTAIRQPDMPAAPQEPPVVDPSHASIARVYDYVLGGKDNFAADREAGDTLIAQYPQIVEGVRANRAFLGRAIRHLAAEAGISQYLDIGTGLPSRDNTHEVAQRVLPGARIVYVDNDPIVLAHAQALLTSTPEGSCAYIDADLRDPAMILDRAAATLDLHRPVAVCLIQVLQFVSDEEDPWQLVQALLAAMPSGSYLTIAHPASDIHQEVTPALRKLSSQMARTRATPRSQEQVTRFFSGLDMLSPGLVQLHRWRPEPGTAGLGQDIAAYAGMARKP